MYLGADRRDAGYNDGNNPSMAPFWFDGETLYVELEQYDAWASTNALDLIRAGPGYNIVPTSHPVPKLSCTDTDQCPDWYLSVYNAINTRSNIIFWHSLIPEAICIPLEENQWETLSVDLVKEALLGIAVPECGWFAKCGTCSTKHVYPPIPVYTAGEIVSHLKGARNVEKALRKGTARCILLRPWEPRISDNCEFRVFVRSGKVTGVSQQACYSVQPVMSMWCPDAVTTAFQELYDQMMAKLKPEHQYIHQCTFDAYITTDQEGEIIPYLIEINSDSFGWGPAGASLFHWIHDPPPQADEEPVYYTLRGCSPAQSI